MDEITVCVEHLIGDDLVEYEYTLEVDWSPFTPGKMYGAPEDCYPDDGGYADVVGDVSRRLAGDDKAEWETVAFSIFLEDYAESGNYKDDPPDKKGGKTRLEKAKRGLDEAAYELCQEAADDALEAAMEQKGEDQRERDMMGDDW